MDSRTNVSGFLSECNAGVLIEKLAYALSEAAFAQTNNNVGNKKAQVGLVFTFQQIGDNNQVMVSHKLSKVIPTHRGKKSEEDATDSAFFVGKGGVLTVTPPKEDSNGQFALEHESESVAFNNAIDTKTGEIRSIRN